MDPTAPNDPKQPSQTGTWTAVTQLADIDWTWSNVSAIVPVHGFTALPQPHVTVGMSTSSLDGWGVYVEPADPHEDPLLTQLVIECTNAYLTDCLGRTPRGDAHLSVVAEYVNAFDRYTSSRGMTEPTESGKLLAEADAFDLKKARQKLMVSVVSALNAETGVLGEYVQNAYLGRTGEATAITVSFADDPTLQRGPTLPSRQ